MTLHNWMYSFMPVEIERPVTFHDVISIQHKTVVYLVGYCKACRKSFSEIVKASLDHMIVTDMTFPRWGCEPIDEAAEALAQTA